MPDFGGSGGVRQQAGTVDQQQRLAVDADVAPVAQGGLQGPDEVQVILVRVVLGDQNFGIETIPAPAPVLVGPADAKWKIRVAG